MQLPGAQAVRDAADAQRRCQVLRGRRVVPFANRALPEADPGGQSVAQQQAAAGQVGGEALAGAVAAVRRTLLPRGQGAAAR